MKQLLTLIVILPLFSSAQTDSTKFYDMGGYRHYVFSQTDTVYGTIVFIYNRQLITWQGRAIVDMRINGAPTQYESLVDGEWINDIDVNKFLFFVRDDMQMTGKKFNKPGFDFKSMPFIESSPVPLIWSDSIKLNTDPCNNCLSISEPDPVIVRLTEKLNAAYNILRLISVNGYVRKKDMPEFIKARDVYIKLNQKP